MDKLVKVLEKHDFVIVNYQTKIEFLRLRNLYPRLKVKIMTVDEVTTQFLGRANDETLKWIMDEYNYQFEYAAVLNQNIIFKDNASLNEKTAHLVNIRTKLITDGLLPTRHLAHATFNNKAVLLSPEYSDHPMLISLLKEANAIINVLEPFAHFKHELLCFATGIDEVYALLNNISKLLDEGTPSAHIKLLRPAEAYLTLVKSLAPQFNLVFNDNVYSLYDYPEIQFFFKNNLNNEVILHEALKTYKADDSSAMRMLKNIYLSLKQKDIGNNQFIKFFITKIKQTKFQTSVNNGIEIINELPLFSVSNDHFFYMNFAEGNAPSNGGVNPFLTNVEKAMLGLQNDETHAKCRESALIYTLSHLKNVHLSYAKVFVDQEYDIPTINGKLGYSLKKSTPSNILYSPAYLQFLTNARRDDLRTYNVLDPLLSDLFISNKKQDEYLSFDYQFSGISYAHQHIYLSASSIELYNNIPFDYFAKYLLDLKNDAHNEHLEYGNFVHKVFELSKDTESFKFVFAQLLDQGNYSAKEKFFINNTRDLIYAGFKNFNEYQRIVHPNKVYKEEMFTVSFGEKYSLNGRVDRLLTFKKDEKTYGLVIDFKTGGIVFEPHKYSAGLNLQLPLYALLILHDKHFGDIEPIALVINSFKPEKHTLSDSELLAESTAKSLKFKGLVIDDIDLLPLLDPNYSASHYFSGLSVSKSKVIKGAIPKEEFANYLALTEEKVMEAFIKINNNEFPVRTIAIRNKRTGEYSEFREISYLPSYAADEEYGEDDECEEI